MHFKSYSLKTSEQFRHNKHAAKEALLGFNGQIHTLIGQKVCKVSYVLRENKQLENDGMRITILDLHVQSYSDGILLSIRNAFCGYKH